MYPLMLCFLHSTHLTLGLVLEAGPVKTHIVFFGGESIEGFAEQKVQNIDHGDTQKYVGAEKSHLEQILITLHNNPSCPERQHSHAQHNGEQRPQKTSMSAVPTIITITQNPLFIYVLIGAAVHKERVKSGREQQVPWDKSATRHKPERNSTSRQSQASRKEFGINDLESCTAVMASHFNI